MRVSKLFDVETFASVHQLVSTVEGQARAGQARARSRSRRVFPAARSRARRSSRAMKIIEELEPQRRGVYCGSIGYIGYDGNMDLNIAIRTLVQHGDRVYAWAGGGVVADSERRRGISRELRQGGRDARGHGSRRRALNVGDSRHALSGRCGGDCRLIPSY